MKARRRYSLQQIFQMFSILGVDLASRWAQAKVPADVENIWNAARKDAKSAYKQRMRQLHPDVNPDPAAEESAKELTALWACIESLKINVKPPPRPVATMVFMTNSGVGTFRTYTTGNAFWNSATDTTTGSW